jgi:hypothetical protein
VCYLEELLLTCYTVWMLVGYFLGSGAIHSVTLYGCLWVLSWDEEQDTVLHFMGACGLFPGIRNNTHCYTLWVLVGSFLR